MLTSPTTPDPLTVIEGLRAEVARLQQALRLKDEQFRLFCLHRFGPKSEKIDPAQLALLLQEASLTAGEVAQVAATAPAPAEKPAAQTKKPRAPHPGRGRLPETLERREEIIPCCPEDCACDKCGAERPIIGYETREELAFTPPEFWIRVVKREKRGTHCLDEQGVATAPAPEQIVPKSMLSNEFIIDALTRKYKLHLPVYRQCAQLLEDHGIDLSRKTVTDAVLAAGDLLTAVSRAMCRELLAGGYIQADETPVPCQTGEKKGRNHQAYMWEYSRPGGIVIFDFRMGRGREGPEKFLKGFRGKLQSDGYGAYAKLGEGIVYVGCMAHARRGFVEASKLAPLDRQPLEIIQIFTQLYAVEQDTKTAGLDPAKRQELRAERSAPVMAALKARILEIRKQILPGGKLASACDYTLGQWSRLQEFLGDGAVEIDNNWCYAARGITPVMPTVGLCRLGDWNHAFFASTQGSGGCGRGIIRGSPGRRAACRLGGIDALGFCPEPFEPGLLPSSPCRHADRLAWSRWTRAPAKARSQ